MKKSIRKGIMAMLAAVSFGVASAVPTVVHVTDGSGINVDFLLADSPAVSYTQEGLRIVAGNVDVVYPVDAAYTFTIAESAGVSDIEVSSSTTVSMNGRLVSVSCLTEGSVINVYDVNGRILASSSADSFGVANVDLSAFHGIALVSTPFKTFKIILK